MKVTPDSTWPHIHAIVFYVRGSGPIEFQKISFIFAKTCRLPGKIRDSKTNGSLTMHFLMNACLKNGKECEDAEKIDDSKRWKVTQSKD